MRYQIPSLSRFLFHAETTATIRFFADPPIGFDLDKRTNIIDPDGCIIIVLPIESALVALSSFLIHSTEPFRNTPRTYNIMRLLSVACRRSRVPVSYFAVMTAAASLSSISSVGAKRSLDTFTTPPSTLHGDAQRVVVPPGQCQFDSDPKPAILLSRIPVSKTSSVLRFSLPDSEKPLLLTTCACLLCHASVNVERITRPYTPISTNLQTGSFDLLVKEYPDGVMSSHLCKELQVSDHIEVTHIPPNVKVSAEELMKSEKVGMIVGGTGITPMIQALHAILGGPDGPGVTLLYGSKNSQDILAKELLDFWAEQYSNRLNIVYVLSEEPEDSTWQGMRGVIDRPLLEEHLPPPSMENSRILICGPPPMYNAISGPRNEADSVTGLLGELGYSAEQVYKF